MFSSSWRGSTCSTWRVSVALAIVSLTPIALADAEAPPLPSVWIENIRGGQTRLDELVAGRPTLILFWNTPCKTCLDKLRAVERFAAERAERGLGFLMINIDPPRNKNQIAPFLHRHGFPAATHVDPGRKVFRRLGGSSAPALILASADGRILHRSLKLDKQDLVTIEALLDPLLHLRDPDD